MIYRKADRCRKIVEQLLNQARPSSPSRHLAPLALRDIVVETPGLLSHRIKRGGAP